MIDNMLNTLHKIHREEAPETIWPRIQDAIERRQLQLIPAWLKVAAVIITLMLLGEVISSRQWYSKTIHRDSNTYTFNQNNQWYHD